MRRLVQPLWVLLALIFLAEAWLWDHLEPVVARVVSWIPLRVLKAWLAARIKTLTPPLTLIVFVVPFIMLFPLKILGVWLLAHHYWLGAIAVIGFGKLLGVGVAAFIFDVTRPKLLQMHWFRRVYNWVMRARSWAHDITAPVMARLRRVAATFRTRSSPRYLRMVWRIRRRMHSAK